MAFQYVDYPQKMKDLLMQIFDDSFMPVSYTHLTLPSN